VDENSGTLSASMKLTRNGYCSGMRNLYSVLGTLRFSHLTNEETQLGIGTIDDEEA